MKKLLYVLVMTVVLSIPSVIEPSCIELGFHPGSGPWVIMESPDGTKYTLTEAGGTIIAER